MRSSWEEVAFCLFWYWDSYMTNAELAVLSLVVEEPRHGYGIESTIEARGMREWTDVGFSSIYYLLKKLEGAGLIEGRRGGESQGPSRTVYETTEAGEVALRAAVLEALSVPQRDGSGFLLGLANLPTLKPGEALEALRENQRSQSARFEYLGERRREQQPLPDHVEAMFDYSEAMLQAEIDWLAQYTTHLEREQSDEH